MAAMKFEDEEEQFSITDQEKEIMRKRRDYILQYKPPVWVSSSPDPVSGRKAEVPMVDHASILFTNTICLVVYRYICWFLDFY